MNPQRLLAALLAACALAPPGFAIAQSYPTKAIRFILPFSAGGAADVLARPIAQRLSETLKQPVVADNRSGAGGNVAMELVAGAPPDGYTIILATMTQMSISVTLYAGRLRYDPLKNFTPITMVGKVPLILAVNASLPAKNLKELIALAKSRPGKFNYGTAGVGTSTHLVGEMLKTEAGFDMTHVPYSGGGPAMNAVLANQIEIVSTPLTTVVPMVRAGRLRGIAVTTAKRSPVLPDVPTIAESGFPGFDASVWYCIAAPAGVPQRIVDTLHAALVTTLTAPDLRDRLTESGVNIETSTPAELAAFVKAEIPKWAKVVKLSGAKPD